MNDKEPILYVLYNQTYFYNKALCFSHQKITPKWPFLWFTPSAGLSMAKSNTLVDGLITISHGHLIYF